MKLKVILLSLLLFCSKIVDSIPHSESLFRQRVNTPSKWQVNQNAQDTQYLDTDFTQTRKVNTQTNSALQQENTQDYNLNQERYNYNGYGYNKSPTSSSSGKELLENYNLQADGRRLESYPPRVESYPPEVGFDNQQLRKQNWRPQNLYTKSIPSAVLITDIERPLVNTVQEPYRAPIQYIQPKYIPSSNQRFYQPERSYLTREQLQYPLANNAGDSKYVANSGPRFGSSGPVPYENYREDQAGASEIISKLTDGQRYQQNLATQSGNLYNEIPAVVVTDTLTDQSENFKYLQNYRSGSDLSNTAPSNSYKGSIPVLENYNLDSKLSNVPETHENYNEGQAAESEIKRRLSVGRRHTQSFAPQSEILFNESPADIATDILEDQFKNIKSINKYRSPSDISKTAITTNYDDDSQVISTVNNYSSGSRPSNGPVTYESYGDNQAAVSEVNPSPIEAQKYVQNFAPQSRNIHDDIPAGIATDVLAEQSTHIKHENRKKYKSRLDSSNTASTTNYDDDSSVISTAESYSEDSRPSEDFVPHKRYGNRQAALSEVKPRQIGGQRYLQEVAPQSRIIYNDVPDVIATDVLADQSKNIRYEKRENYKTLSDSSNIAPITDQNDDSLVILTSDNTNSDSKPSNPTPDNIKKKAPLDVNKILSDTPLARRYARNYKSETGSSNTVRDNSFNTASTVISETVEEKSRAYEVNDRSNEPVPFNTYSETSSTSSHTLPTKQKRNKIEESDVPPYGSSSPNPSDNPNTHHKEKELNINEFDIQKLFDGSTKPYLVIHPNGTVEQLDTIDIQSQSNSYLRLVNTKRINVGDTESDGRQSTEIVPNNIAKAVVPLNESPLLGDSQPAYYKKSTPVDVNQAAYESESKHSNKAPANQINSKPPHAKLTPSLVNQPTYDDNPKLPLVKQPRDDNKFKPLHPYVPHRTHHHKSKPTDAHQLAHDKKLNPSLLDGNQPAVEKSKPQHLNKNRSDDNDSILSSPDENQPSDVNVVNLPTNENQSGNDKTSEPLRRPHKRWSLKPENDEKIKKIHLHHRLPAHRNKSKSTPENQQKNDTYYPKGDANNFNSSSLDENPSINNDSYPEKLLENDNKSKPLSPLKEQPAHHNKPKLSHKDKPENDDNSPKNKPKDNSNFNLSSLDENLSINNDSYPEKQLENDNKSKPLSSFKEQPASHNKPKLSHKGKPENDENSPKEKSRDNSNFNSSPLDEYSLINDNSFTENKPEENPHKIKAALHNKSKPSHKSQSEPDKISPQNEPKVDYNSNSWRPDDNQSIEDDSFPENKPENPHKRKPALHYKPKPSHKDQSETDKISPQNEPKDDNNFNSSSLDDYQSEEEDTYSQNNSEDVINSVSLLGRKNQLKHKIKTKPLSPNDKQPTVSKTDDQPVSTTLSPGAPNYTTSFKSQLAKKYKHRHISRKSTTSSPIVGSTTSSPIETSDDQIITLSPIEQVTDNVSDVPPVTSSTTTVKPIETPGKSDTIKIAKNKQDNTVESPSGDFVSIADKVRTSTATASTSSSTISTESISDNKTTEETALHKNIQTTDNVKNNTQTDDNQQIDEYSVPENKPGNPYKRKPTLNYKPKPSHQDQSETDEVSPQNEPKDDNNSSSWSPDDDQSTEYDSFPENRRKRKPGLHYKPNPSYKDQSETDKISPQNEPKDDDNSSSWSPDDDQSIEYDSFPENPSKRKPGLHYKPKPSHKDQLETDQISPQNEPKDDNDSNSSSLDDYESEEEEEEDTYLENNSEDDINSVSLLERKNQLKHKKNSKPLSPNDKQPTASKTGDQPVSTTSLKPQLLKKYKHRHNSRKSTTSSPNDYQSEEEEEDTYLQNNSEDDINSVSLFERKNQLKQKKKSKPLRPNNKQPTASKTDDQPVSTTLSPAAPNYTTTLKPQLGKKYKHKHISRKSTTSSPNDYQSEEEDTYLQNNSEDEIESKNQLKQKKKSKPLRPNDKQPTASKTDTEPVSTTISPAAPNYATSLKPQLAKKYKHRHISRKSTTSLPNDQSEEEDTYLQNNSEDDINSITLLERKNQLEHKKKSKPLRPNDKQPTASKTDDQPASTTLSPAAPNYTTSVKPQLAKKYKHRHISRKSTTSSSIVSSTTPGPIEISDDQIITLSPIEQVTDNVSDVSLVTTSTTTVKPIEMPGKSDTVKNAKNKQDNSVKSPPRDFASIADKVRTSTATTSTSSSTISTESISDNKTTEETVLHKNTQTNDNVKNNSQTVQSAVFNSSKLLDTNTDVPAESDDNSPVTTSPSVQNDESTGDTSGVNTLELQQPETDIIITVSSSTDNDSEVDTITINVEVFESTGSPSNNKSLLVSIDTDNDSDDDSETPQPSDCKKNPSDDDGRGKNLKIDLSNLQGEPTMWIRTSNQDFIDKLTDKKNTAFDMVYFFNIVSQPAIEKEKVTTIHCNGTVVIETNEITYANKDDPTPTIVKTTQTVQLEDYKRNGLD